MNSRKAINRLIRNLGAALTALGIPLPAYIDATIYNGQNGQRTVVKRDHIRQLREAATRGKGVASGGGGTAVPADGLDALSYDSASNRISTAGWEYDSSGNQTRARSVSGGWQRYEYDAAGRLVRVLTDDRLSVIASYTYGSSNERLVTEEGGSRTYYVAGGAGVIMEYAEAANSTQPLWSKSYVYLGARLLSVITPDGGGGESVEYHHPDRLGTRLISNSANSSVQEQATLPFGTVLAAETSAATNRRFTSYDRSASTGLDYAVNRHYDSLQGRFTQVDPIGMSAASLANPQSLNLYSYCGNDPVNHTDPAGLFWGKLLHFLSKVFKWVGIALAVAAIVVTAAIVFTPASSFIFKGALWALTHVLLPLSRLPVIGGMVSLYGLSSPSWNPHSRSIFGNSFQDGSGGHTTDAGGYDEDGVVRIYSSTGPPTIYEPIWVQLERRRSGRSQFPHSPAPIWRLPPLTYSQCFQSYKFSSNFTGTGRTIAEFLEVGGWLSLGGDAAATTVKIASRSAYIGGTKNRYASGLNFVFRRGADAVGSPALKGTLTSIGSKVTPVLTGIGVFNGSYNATVAVQCATGVLN